MNPRGTRPWLADSLTMSSKRRVGGLTRNSQPAGSDPGTWLTVVSGHMGDTGGDFVVAGRSRVPDAMAHDRTLEKLLRICGRLHWKVDCDCYG